MQMERPIRIEYRAALEHNARCLVELIELRAVFVEGWTIQQSPYYNQQLADLNRRGHTFGQATKTQIRSSLKIKFRWIT